MKPKYIPLGIGLAATLCIAICVGSIEVIRLNRLIVENQQHYLYCDLLKPNMTLEDVRDVLGKFGSYQENESHINNTTRVRVVYDNLFTSYRFGGETILTFKDGLLVGEEVPYGIGESRGICENWR